MKRTHPIILSVAAALVLCLSACSFSPDSGTQAKTLSQQIQEANSQALRVETQTVTMTGETAGTVTVTVELPDYEALFQAAYAQDDPDQALLKALQSGNFDTKEYQITAQVTVEDGKEVLHTDEAVQALLEQELLTAIQNLAEVSKS